MPDSTAYQLVDHLFRHEAGKMIAVLSRIFGIRNFELVEDVVQEAFLKAIQTWKFEKIPENPQGWLMQTARNKAIDVLRRQQNFKEFSVEIASQLQQQTEYTIDNFFLDSEIADSQLQMIFACCHPSLKPEDQLAFTLKSISGFSVSEIARALLTQETAIQKRLYRAKQFLQEKNIQLEIPAGQQLSPRLETVYTVLYLMFNEGYNSITADELIRRDLCSEAMRLCLLLSEHPVGNKSETHALLSMMCFHASRFDSRIDENNDIILLAAQDRLMWNKELIRKGYYYLDRSAFGDHLSIYHIESAISAEHCMAETFNKTNWSRMLLLYDLLLEYKKTPVVLLNRAIVLAELNRVNEAIEEILSIEKIDQLLATQYIYNAVLGEMYSKNGEIEKAKKCLEQAESMTNSIAEKKLLRMKMKTLNGRMQTGY